MSHQVVCPGWPWIWWRAMLLMPLNPGVLNMQCKLEPVNRAGAELVNNKFIKNLEHMTLF